LKYHYLKKLSGKNYHPDTVKNILISLGFIVAKESIDELVVTVPFHKPDISLPADLVEEIVRIDGLDNIEIPASITMTPSVEENYSTEFLREKVAGYLVGLGFYEIMTNSITSEVYFDEDELKGSVRMLNSLSAELNIMRPAMLETGLESIAHNLNRKNNDLKFFDFGKTYNTAGRGKYYETEHLCIYVTGNAHEESWHSRERKADLFYLKGVILSLAKLLGLSVERFETIGNKKLSPALQVRIGGAAMIQFGSVHTKVLTGFDIRQPVFFADINWDLLVELAQRTAIKVEEVPRFPAVSRDLAIVVSLQTNYEKLERLIQSLKLTQLQKIKLFDVFESEKLGEGKKSMAINFTFLDKEKTLTDKEIDEMMGTIIMALEKEVNADIRK
jgi:phenylalanyl-tRNA synthetase beta chain